MHGLVKVIGFIPLRKWSKSNIAQVACKSTQCLACRTVLRRITTSLRLFPQLLLCLGVRQPMSLRTCQPVARPWSCKAAFTSPSSSCVHFSRAPVLLKRSSNTRERFTSNGRRWSAALENNAQVDVSVPLETAWDLWRDKTQIIKWMPWINRIEIVPDDPKQSKWVLCTNQFGRNWELSWRALDLTPIKHQKIHWRSLPGSNSSGIEVPNRGQVRFYKKGPNACTVKLTITYEVPGPLTPFASAITPLVERILQTDMNRFRTYATLQQQ